jgi:hypothetical protein
VVEILETVEKQERTQSNSGPEGVERGFPPSRQFLKVLENQIFYKSGPRPLTLRIGQDPVKVIKQALQPVSVRLSLKVPLVMAVSVRMPLKAM